MEKLKSALSYVIPLVGGIVVFFITKKEEYNTKFHAVQGIVFWLVAAVLETICAIIPLIGWLLWKLMGLVFLAILVWAIWKIVKDQEPELPILGDVTKAILKNI